MGHKVKQSLMSSRIDFFYYAFRNVLLVSVSLLTFSVFIFTIPHSSATISDSSADSVTLTLSTSCTLSSSVLEVHNANLNGGQYKEDIGNTRINAYCNDNNGYNIYAIGYSGDVDGNTELIGESSSNYNIATGIYNPTGPNNSSLWSMKLTPGNGSDITSSTPPTINNGYDSYNVIPNVYTLVASRTSGTNMTIDTDITGSYFNTTYNIYASSVQPAGSYEGRVKYVMIHPHSDNSNITIENAFALNGKERHGLHYAMQDITTEICNAANVYDEASQTQLIDTRDNKLYWVAKLQDGHCWMTQNLDLDLETTPTNVAPLTSENTDLNDGSGSGAYSVGYNYDPDSKIISWIPTNTTRDYQHNTGTSWRNDHNITYSLDPGEWYWDGDDDTPSCNYLDPNQGCVHFTQNKTGVNQHLTVGNYYNWSAAIASNGSSSLNTSTYNDISLNPKNSICPKGWRLPTISNVPYTTVNSTSEFGRLNQLYNSGGNTDQKLILNPLWFVRSGNFYNNNLDNPGSGAFYWSSTVSSSQMAYILNFTTSTIQPASNFYTNYIRWRGGSIRCLAR